MSKMENKKLAKFKSLVSDKKSDYLNLDIEKEKRLLRARVVFKVLDYINSSNPKITREQFAKKIGVTKQYVSKLLRGNENLTMDTMQKIAYAMEIEFHELVQPPKEIEIPSGTVECQSHEAYAKLAMLFMKMEDLKLQTIYFSKSEYDQEVNYEEL